MYPKWEQGYIVGEMSKANFLLLKIAKEYIINITIIIIIIYNVYRYYVKTIAYIKGEFL